MRIEFEANQSISSMAHIQKEKEEGREACSIAPRIDAILGT